jgi:CubicO group peptidase (beta-lactamase class C family)
LVLAGGRWQGRQIVDEAFLRDSVKPWLPAELDWHYGYLWRMGSVNVAGRPVPWVGAFGNGGQRLYLVPSLDVAMVITAGRYNAPPRENGLPSQQLFERAMIQLAATPSS